jgi:hypothetical protein
MFGFQQRTNMETNKGDNWLEAIVISNYETMWLAHGSQVIDHVIAHGVDRSLFFAFFLIYPSSLVIQ